MLTKYFALALLATSLAAQWNTTGKGVPVGKDGKPNLTAPAPRRADGKPDLSGIWNCLLYTSPSPRD